MKATSGGRRSLEEMIAALDGPAVDAPRPWPIEGRPIGLYDEEDYRRACRTDAAPTHLVCARRRLMACSDGDFVAAAYKAIAGHEPDRSRWHHHTARLAAGEGTRDDLLRELQESRAGRMRNVMIIDRTVLRPFVEMTEVGLRDVTRLLLGLMKRQLRRRVKMGVDRVLRRRHPR